jgi:hypothetical protein
LRSRPTAVNSLRRRSTKALEMNARRDRRKIISGRPVLGAIFDTPIDGPGLERFESNARIAKIVETELIEVVRPDVGWKAFPPIVLDALINDRAAALENLDPIRAGAEWRVQRVHVMP